LEKLHQEGGKELVELLHIPGLGPKRVAILYHELDVQTPKQLLRAIHDGRLRQLHGFGEKTEQNILGMLQVHAQQERRFKLAVAAQYAQSLVDYLREANEIEEIIIAGSYRRCKETVGDLDILVTTTQPKPVVERFTRYDEVKEVLSEGTTRSPSFCAMACRWTCVRSSRRVSAPPCTTSPDPSNITSRSAAGADNATSR